jgi:histidinol-phosphate aminotransferase
MSASYRAWLDKKLAKLGAIDCYSAGVTPEGLADQLGVESSEIVKLNFNENLYIDRAKQTDIMKQLCDEIDLRMYPEDEEIKLRQKLSRHLAVPEDFLVVGNAGDELIDRMVRLFIEPSDAAVAFTPSFAIPRLCVKRQGGQYIEIPLNADFQLNINAMLDAFSEKTRLLYLCSPNNPTANQLNPNDIEKLTQAFPGIVILDEAYGEFADYSFISRIQEFPNMIILRTFSKAFGLAMLRLGYAVANPELAKVMRDKSPLPYPVSGFSIRMGIKMLENITIAQSAVSALITERINLIDQLNQIKGIQAFASQADFVLINTQTPADQLYTKLLKRGIILKKWGKLLQYANCFRITVGLPEMNAKLIEALKQIQEGENTQ